MNLLVNIFEGCNEGIIAKETEGIGSVVKWGKKLSERGSERKELCENPVRFSLNDGPMETVKYMWVNIWCMLD